MDQRALPTEIDCHVIDLLEPVCRTIIKKEILFSHSSALNKAHRECYSLHFQTFKSPFNISRCSVTFRVSASRLPTATRFRIRVLMQILLYICPRWFACPGNTRHQYFLANMWGKSVLCWHAQESGVCKSASPQLNTVLLTCLFFMRANHIAKSFPN